MNKIKFTHYYCTLLFLLLATSTVFSQKIPKRKIKKLIENSEILNEHFTGFALFDQDKDKMIFEQNDSIKSTAPKLPKFSSRREKNSKETILPI